MLLSIRDPSYWLHPSPHDGAAGFHLFVCLPGFHVYLLVFVLFIRCGETAQRRQGRSLAITLNRTLTRETQYQQNHWDIENGRHLVLTVS